MNSLRVLVLMDEDCVPPDNVNRLEAREAARYKTERDVLAALHDLGHDVHPLGVDGELTPIREAVASFKPHIVFNLLEEFAAHTHNVCYLLGFLELIGHRYTGCNARGMVLASSKSLQKKILRHHRIHVPDYAFIPRGRTPRVSKRLRYPLIVKSTTSHGSMGIAKASLVYESEKLVERAAFVHEQLRTDAIAEEYIDGRELYVGLIGNARIEAFATWELRIDNLPDGAPRIATEKAKWDLKYQRKIGLKTEEATDLPPATLKEITRVCKRAYRALELSGYARMDLRLRPDGSLYLLEANPNPNLAADEDFAESAHAVGITYEQLIQRILNLGLKPLARLEA